MFHVGQKVWCVHASNLPGRQDLQWRDKDGPTEGAVYTITAFYHYLGDPTVQLAELKRGPWAIRQWGLRAGYHAERFRPIVERKTDISFAHEILRKAAKPTKVRA